MKPTTQVGVEDFAPSALYRDARSLYAAKASAAPITTLPPATEHLAEFISGLVVSEGCFFKTGARPKFVFAVSLGACDETTCRLLKSFLGVGSLVYSPRRKPHYDDEVTFHVRKLAHLVEVVVPFMDQHLASSYKRLQYETWRDELLDYWEHKAKRVGPCSLKHCAEPRQAHGLCQKHLFLICGQ